jgi:hypothetical protein
MPDVSSRERVTSVPPNDTSITSAPGYRLRTGRRLAMPRVGRIVRAGMVLPRPAAERQVGQLAGPLPDRVRVGLGEQLSCRLLRPGLELPVRFQLLAPPGRKRNPAGRNWWTIRFVGRPPCKRGLRFGMLASRNPGGDGVFDRRVASKRVT